MSVHLEMTQGLKIHLPLVPHICVSESGQLWLRQLLVAYLAPSHYLNQCWLIVNWTLRNKLQWNFNRNKKLFIHGNASENIVCKTATILLWQVLPTEVVCFLFLLILAIFVIVLLSTITCLVLPIAIVVVCFSIMNKHISVTHSVI